jgi:hypothetical protein
MYLFSTLPSERPSHRLLKPILPVLHPERIMALADLHGISQQLGDRFERYPWYYPLRDAKAISHLLIKVTGPPLCNPRGRSIFREI